MDQESRSMGPYVGTVVVNYVLGAIGALSIQTANRINKSVVGDSYEQLEQEGYRLPSPLAKAMLRVCGAASVTGVYSLLFETTAGGPPLHGVDHTIGLLIATQIVGGLFEGIMYLTSSKESLAEKVNTALAYGTAAAVISSPLFLSPYLQERAEQQSRFGPLVAWGEQEQTATEPETALPVQQKTQQNTYSQNWGLEEKVDTHEIFFVPDQQKSRHLKEAY